MQACVIRRMKTFIYILRCPETNEVRYVGKSNDPKRRIYAHVRKDKTASNHKINWIQSLLKRGLRPKLEIIEEVDIENWRTREKFWIKYFKRIGAKLTNYCSGGEGLSFGNQTSFKKGNVPHNAGKGKPYEKICPICKEVFKVAKSGVEKYVCCSRECHYKHQSQNKNAGQFEKGLSPWNKGKKYKQSNSKNCVAISQLNKETLELINKYPSASEAERQTGINQDSITNNTAGRSESAGGFVWVKQNEIKIL
jgi:group I intron endonuclease